jgi:hypothetical protein
MDRFGVNQSITVSRIMFKFTPLKHWLATGICCAFLAVAGHAAELAVGDAVPAFSAKDQFGKEFKFAPGPKFLLLGFDMSASKAANQKLATLGAGGLDKYGAVYMMDIHTMPGIARVFALPKMQKYPFRVILAATADVLAPFPHQEEKITVLALTPEGKIREIRYWNPATEASATVFD